MSAMVRVAVVQSNLLIFLDLVLTIEIEPDLVAGYEA